MAQYITYDEYKEYGGTLSEQDFILAEFKARSRLDWITLARIGNMETVPEAVKLAMMTVMKVDSKYSPDAQADSAIVSSFSTDGYSESYGSASEQSDAANRQLNKQIQQMLFGILDDNGVPLIYKGVE